ncbi:MAG: response regulator [Bacteroidales bacterium]|nr:response regulator [Bacteroidales bacterium]
MILRLYTILFLTLAFCSFTSAVKYVDLSHNVKNVRYSIAQYTTLDGMGSDKVFGLMQDSHKNVWIATDFSLDRFDGKTFHHYTKDKYPELQRNDLRLVKKCVVNGKEEIFVGSCNGLCMRYDEKLDKFIDVKPLEYEENLYKEPHYFKVCKDGNCYMSTVDGLYKYDGERFTHEFDQFHSTQGLFILDFYLDNHQRFYYGGIQNFTVMDKHGKVIKKYIESDGCSGLIIKFIELSESRLAVVGTGSTILVLNTGGDSIQVESVVKLPFFSTYDAILASDGKLYLATDGDGLWRVDTDLNDNSVLEHILSYGEQPKELSKVYTIMQSADNDIWLGTQMGGVFRLSLDRTKGVNYSSDFGLENFVVSDFLELPDGDVLMTTDGQGVLILDDNFKIKKKISLTSNNIMRAVWNKAGNIWLSTWGDGILELNPVTFKTKILEFENPEFVRPKCVYSVTELSNGEIYLCTAGVGLWVKRTSGKWEQLDLREGDYTIEDNWVFSALETPNHNVWIVTSNSIALIKDGVVKHALPCVVLEKTHTPIMFADSKMDSYGNLYVATTRGIMVLIESTLEYKMLDYLPSSLDFRSIEKKNDGTFVCATSAGILSFNPTTQKYSLIPTNSLKTQKKFFTNSSLLLRKSGQILAGTSSGFYIVSDSLKQQNNKIGDLNWGSVYVDGDRVHPDGVLPVEASHNKNVNIEVKVADFRENVNDRLYYKLEGKDDKWSEVPEDKTIRFSYLPSGNFKLKVAYLEDANKNEPTDFLEMRLNVSPEWYRSWWFYLVVLAFVVLGFKVAYEYRLRKHKIQEKILKEKVAERTEELRTALDMKENIISVIAHDLKNSMFGIVGALSQYNDDNCPKTQETEKLKKAYEQASTLQNTMLSLVNWAIAKRETTKPVLVETDVVAILEEVVNLNCAVIEDKQISIVRRFKTTDYASSDERMLSTILRNLMNNSIKYTPQNGEIVLSTYSKDGKFFVEFSDNGKGMTKEQLAVLRSSSGVIKNGETGFSGEVSTGLGYSLIYSYLDILGATMHIESEVGKGTQITVEMPAVEPKKSDKKLDVNEKISLDFSFMQNKRILVVEDDELILDNLKNLLSGYSKVDTANNGQVAYTMALQTIPDLIVSDLQMPIVNGFELCKMLRSQDKTKNIPFVVMSASGSETAKLSTLKVGALDYINKPFKNEEMLLKIYNILKLKNESPEFFGNTQDESLEIGFVKDFNAMIEQHYTESDLTIGKMASLLCMSTATLGRRCSTHFDKTPIQLLLDYRMNLSHTMLTMPNQSLSISDIAYKVGFSDPAYFSKKFKEYFGVAPSQVIG